MASAISVTCSSSKQSRVARFTIKSAIGGIGSSPRPWPNRARRDVGVPDRQAFIW